MKRIFMMCICMAGVFSLPAQVLVKDQWVTTPSGLQVMLLQASDGEKPDKGDRVAVHYTGRLEDSTIFDNSLTRGVPIEFPLGQGRVIRGWDEGIAMLKTGEKAKFLIPPALGYGANARTNIPANSTLIFDVELVAITAKGARLWDVTGKDTLNTPSGLQYIIVSEGTGIRVEKGMKTKVHYSGYLLNGDKFDSSVDRGQPYEVTVGKRQVIAGWEEGLALLKVGDKARLIIPYQLAYGEAGRAPVIPPKATLLFDIEIVDAVVVEPPKPYDVKGLDTIKTASGLQYIVVQRSELQQVTSGSKAIVHYTGFLESGEIFDSSVERGQPFEVEVGKGRVIRGWDEGLQLLRKGEKARFIIPWSLAYGEAGMPPVIPPKANLIFDVEILEVK